MTNFLKPIEYFKLIVEYGTQIGDILNRKEENYVGENPFSANLCQSKEVLRAIMFGACPMTKPKSVQTLSALIFKTNIFYT